VNADVIALCNDPAVKRIRSRVQQFDSDRSARDTNFVVVSNMPLEQMQDDDGAVSVVAPHDEY
jgi:hypothetical protein